MILVVCPNLAVDVTLEVSSLEIGGVHRARSASRRAGGKGVNVARALAALGESPVILGLAGGRRGEEIAAGLDAEGLASALVPIACESRCCTIVLTGDGRATVVNESGPAVGDEESEALLLRFDELLHGARAVACMGSLPPGVPVDLYASMLARARERGAFRLLDASGEPLRRALPSAPSVAKPNRGEAEELLGYRLDDAASRHRALAELRARGAETAMITLGAEGVLVKGEDLGGRFWTASSRDLRLGNPTGAGDALAAGLLAGWARGYSLAESTRLGVAAATASLAEGYGRIRARDLRPEAVRFAPDSAG